MGYTKRQFLAGAFDEMGISNYVFDAEPDQLESAMRRLDSMMAEWNARGIRLGYPIPSSPDDSDLDEPSGVPDSANEAIITNLAIRLAPSIGKVPSPDTKIAAKSSYGVLLSRACMPGQMSLGYLPAGAGSKPAVNGDVFLPAQADTLDVGPDSTIEYE